MNVLCRYLLRNVVQATLLVLFVLFSLEIFINLASQLDELGTGGYGLSQAIIYVLLDLPQQMYVLFPMACLLGTLIGLGSLANHSELVAMQAAGVSRYRIARYVLLSGILLISIATLIGEGIAPFTEHLAEHGKAVATSPGQAFETIHGYWVRDGQSFIHIRSILPGGHLQGISRYEFDNQNRLVTSNYAEEAYYQNNAWTMVNVKQSILSERTVQVRHLDQMQWNLALSPLLLQLSLLEPEQMSLKQLWVSVNYLKQNALHDDRYNVAFWKRVLQPLASLVMIFLAIPFVFGPLRSSSTSSRFLIGTLLGFGFYLLNAFFAPMSMVLQAPAWLAALSPILIFLAIAMILLRYRI